MGPQMVPKWCQILKNFLIQIRINFNFNLGHFGSLGLDVWRNARSPWRLKIRAFSSLHASYTVAPEGVAGFKALRAFRRPHCMRAGSVTCG